MTGPSLRGIALTGILLLAGTSCVTSPPSNLDNACAILHEKDDWYEDTAGSRKRWGLPISTQLAIVHQESRFRGDVRPRRRRFLWIFPGPRLSSAYGYSQALESTWMEYKEATGNRGADRDDFADAVDFIGWYAARAHSRLGIALTDTYSLYLAYHEGLGGYARGSYRDQPHVRSLARKVATRAAAYRRQLLGCEESLRRPWWQFW